MRKITAKVLHNDPDFGAKVVEKRGDLYEVEGYQFLIYWSNDKEDIWCVELSTGLSLSHKMKLETRSPRKDALIVLNERIVQKRRMKIAMEKGIELMQQAGIKYPLNDRF